jgi:hypothetical protein
MPGTAERVEADGGDDVNRWAVTRTGTTLRVELAPDALEHADEIAEAVERSADDTVEVVRVSGAALEQPRRGVTALLRRVSAIATARGKRFQVGPI